MGNPENVRSRADGRLSRRRMLGLSTTALGLVATGIAGCGTAEGTTSGVGAAATTGDTPSHVTAPPAVGVLGANLNQDLDAMNFAELQTVSATWLRGFYPMQDADQGNLADQPGM